jgi:hypothetical protein
VSFPPQKKNVLQEGKHGCEKGPLKFNGEKKRLTKIYERKTRPSIRLRKPRELEEIDSAGIWIDGSKNQAHLNVLRKLENKRI